VLAARIAMAGLRQAAAGLRWAFAFNASASAAMRPMRRGSNGLRKEPQALPHGRQALWCRFLIKRARRHATGDSQLSRACALIMRHMMYCHVIAHTHQSGNTQCRHPMGTLVKSYVHSLRPLGGGGLRGGCTGALAHRGLAARRDAEL